MKTGIQAETIDFEKLKAKPITDYFELDFHLFEATPI